MESTTVRWFAFFAVAIMIATAAAAESSSSSSGAEAAAVQGDACNPSELSPCLPAIRSSAAPSGQCCAKLKQQRPCFCGYLKNPNLKQYIGSPRARTVAGACGIPIPSC